VEQNWAAQRGQEKGKKKCSEISLLSTHTCLHIIHGAHHSRAEQKGLATAACSQAFLLLLNAEDIFSFSQKKVYFFALKYFKRATGTFIVKLHSLF